MKASIFKKEVWVNTSGRRTKNKWLFLKIDCGGESNEDLWWGNYWSTSDWKSDEISDFEI